MVSWIMREKDFEHDREKRSLPGWTGLFWKEKMQEEQHV